MTDAELTDDLPTRYTTMRTDGDRVIYDREKPEAWVCSDAWVERVSIR
jgi:hypothetical protein